MPTSSLLSALFSRSSRAVLLALATATVAFTVAAESPAPAPAAPTAAKLPIRIKTGITEAYKDETGVQWLPDQGFADGDTIARPDIEIANTKTPSVYRAERYSMTRFSLPVPNGKYTVKLHFAETYEEISMSGGRIFSFTVEDKEFKDFDPVAKAGSPRRAYIETVEVEIKDGRLDLTFTPKVENPEINALEILPR